MFAVCLVTSNKSINLGSSSKASSGRTAAPLLETLDVLFDLFERGAALALKVLKLLDGLPEHPLLEEVINQFVMVLGRVEPGENLHRVDDVALLLGFLALLLLHALEVQETALQHELLATDALIDARIVELYHVVLKLDVLLSIILEVFKVSEEGVGVAIEFLIEITSLRHVTNDLSKVWDSRLRVIVVGSCL